MAQRTRALSSGDWQASTALGLLALIPRLYVALAWAREPVWDGHYYHFGAKRIAAGLGYSEDVVVNGVLTWKPWCHYPVGYSGFLGGLYRVLGPGLWVAPLANALVGTLVVVLIHRIARTWLSPPRARWAGLLVALHPGLILYTALVMTEGLAGLLLIAAACAALASRRRGRSWPWVSLSGVLVGLGALVRPPALLMLPWHAFLLPGGWRRRIAWLALTGLACCMAIAPWTARNCRVMDDCALISTNGGWNLAIGAMGQTGRFETIRAGMGCPGPGQVRQDRCWGDVGRARIANEPSRWLALIPKKLRHTFNHESFAVGYLREANPGLFSEATWEQLRRLQTGWHHLLLLVAALGCIARPSLGLPRRALASQSALLVALVVFVGWALNQSEPPLYWLAVGVPALALIPWPGRPPLAGVAYYALGGLLMTAATSALFFGEDRYHMPVSPLLALLAAGALRSSACAPPKSAP